MKKQRKRQKRRGGRSTRTRRLGGGDAATTKDASEKVVENMSSKLNENAKDEFVEDYTIYRVLEFASKLPLFRILETKNQAKEDIINAKVGNLLKSKGTIAGSVAAALIPSVELPGVLKDDNYTTNVPFGTTDHTVDVSHGSAEHFVDESHDATGHVLDIEMKESSESMKGQIHHGFTTSTDNHGSAITILEDELIKSGSTDEYHEGEEGLNSGGYLSMTEHQDEIPYNSESLSFRTEDWGPYDEVRPHGSVLLNYNEGDVVDDGSVFTSSTTNDFGRDSGKYEQMVNRRFDTFIMDILDVYQLEEAIMRVLQPIIDSSEGSQFRDPRMVETQMKFAIVSSLPVKDQFEKILLMLEFLSNENNVKNIDDVLSDESIKGEVSVNEDMANMGLSMLKMYKDLIEYLEVDPKSFPLREFAAKSIELKLREKLDIYCGEYDCENGVRIG